MFGNCQRETQYTAATTAVQSMVTCQCTMIPRRLTDWTLNVLAGMLKRGVFEDETFDFKEMLPDSRNNDGKDRLKKTCAAFANSEGGFLVFGVTNSKKTPERIPGIDANLDFPEQFGNFPKSCSPSVAWEFRNPPLRLVSGRVVHIVYVPKGWRAPHAVEASGAWAFQKRTNKGNEPMSIEEVRSAFLGFYEKRLKLQLLRSEILTLADNAQDIRNTDPKKYSLVSFDTAIIDSVIADTYSITAERQKLHQALSRLRQATRIANNRIHLLFSVVMMPHIDKRDIIRSHNEFMAPKATQIEQDCQAAITELNKLLDA